jgi:hypothetical protein
MISSSSPFTRDKEVVSGKAGVGRFKYLDQALRHFVDSSPNGSEFAATSTTI